MAQVVAVREFQVGDAEAFRALNEEWILRYFALEKKDVETLSDPEGTILAHGGRIFFATCDGVPAGCVALLPMGEGSYEVGKMAVTARSQRLGLGRKLMMRAIEAAKESRATRLYLETNHALTPAISLYESVGFRHLPPAESPFKRADVRMEMLLV
jgi:GNAT superfamily N-acetyltransferase